MSVLTSKAIQLRIQPELLEQVKIKAEKHKLSANRIVLDAINLYLKTEKDREWRAGFEAMGKDPDVLDVDFMLPVAREVVFGE